jgi:hypothetical protein
MATFNTEVWYEGLEEEKMRINKCKTCHTVLKHKYVGPGVFDSENICPVHGKQDWWIEDEIVYICKIADHTGLYITSGIVSVKSTLETAMYFLEHEVQKNQTGHIEEWEIDGDKLSTTILNLTGMWTTVKCDD